MHGDGRAVARHLSAHAVAAARFGRYVEAVSIAGRSLAEITQRLHAALAHRYAVERELGRGGMAFVFLAQDLKQHRSVAIKVLRPDLAAVMGPDRFLREIDTAANLTHPHILPLHDSGEADGLLYYVMPYVEGESLRDRLRREKQLPLEDALQIAREVADALSYAHSHDVVHRDIKPENILLHAAHAVVTDFGIARAITAAGGEQLTETGVALGTPAYMSPEQAAGDRQVDGRADLYALGCVLYEMLAGQPPFTGPTAESILHQHLAAEAPLVTGIRRGVPAAIATAIHRALAKAPADRFATAAQFADALDAASILAVTRVRPSRWVAIAGTAALVLGVMAGVRLWPRGGVPLDPDLIAVLPFRVTGADPSLAYLREGVVELLAAKLTGEGGPRAVDPALVLRAFAGSPADIVPTGLAIRLGAGRALTGSIVGTSRRVVLSASILDARTGRTRATAEVSGPADSLLDRIDGLTALLLLRQAGEGEDRLASVTTTSLPALRAYLDGRAAYRRRDYEGAARDFRLAGELDSTFALAGVWMEMCSAWLEDDNLSTRGLNLAWRYRARLTPRDRTILTAQAGLRYPDFSTFSEWRAGWENAVAAAPDRPEVWFRLGDALLHYGQAYGVMDAPERAYDAFLHAVELDSTFGDALHHLVELAAAKGDTATTRRWARQYADVVGGSAEAPLMRWMAAQALDDRAAQAELRDRFRRGEDPIYKNVLGEMVRSGRGLEDADIVRDAVRRSARTRDERAFILGFLREIALNRGRPDEALHLIQSWEAAEPTSRLPLRWRVVDALFGEGDDSAAVTAVVQLERSADGPPRQRRAEREEQLRDVCVVALWRVARRDFRSIRAAIEQLRGVSLNRDESGVAQGAMCAAALEAQLQVQDGSAEPGAAIRRLDSLLLNERWPLFALDPTILILAGVREATGDRLGALAAVRRRTWGQYCCQRYLSTFLREEGRLAEATGDDAGAIRAYRHYLALRTGAEPALQREIERIRTELKRLEQREQ